MNRRTLNDWLDYIQTVHKREIELGLERVKIVGQRLSCLEFNCPVITITGSNGKGTTAHFLAHTYHLAGYRVGLYTSPHLCLFNERIRIDNQPISDDKLIACFEAIEQTRGQTLLTFFEYTTLAALQAFQQSNCDVVILEVGLGGRLDAVNAVDSDCAVLTTVSLEHTDWLGESRELIAKEKSMISRAGKPFICAEPKPPTTVKEIADAQQAILIQYPNDYEFEMDETSTPKTWTWQSGALRYDKLTVPRIPTINAATALKVLSVMQTRCPVSETHIRTSCQTCQVPGRMQWLLDQAVPTLIDVAHNPESSHYLHRAYLREKPNTGKCWCLFSMLKGKDVVGTIQPWLETVDHWVIVPIQDKRAQSIEQLHAQCLAVGVNPAQCELKSDSASAYAWILNQCQREDHILVFGSFYLLGELLNAL